MAPPNNTKLGFGPYLPKPPSSSDPDVQALSRYVSDMFTRLINQDNAINATATSLTASDIVVTPYGVITGTDVQSALQELADSDALKLPSASYTAADILTKIKTVDGSGSGLDADLLDGQSSAAYSATTRTLTAATTRSFALTDAGNVCWNNTGGAVTMTVPLHSSVAWPTGTQIDLLAWSTTITIAAASGVTINAPNGLLTVGPQFGGATLLCLAADFWDLFGSLQ